MVRHQLLAGFVDTVQLAIALRIGAALRTWVMHAGGGGTGYGTRTRLESSAVEAGSLIAVGASESPSAPPQGWSWRIPTKSRGEVGS